MFGAHQSIGRPILSLRNHETCRLAVRTLQPHPGVEFDGGWSRGFATIEIEHHQPEITQGCLGIVSCRLQYVVGECQSWLAQTLGEHRLCDIHFLAGGSFDSSKIKALEKGPNFGAT